MHKQENLGTTTSENTTFKYQESNNQGMSTLQEYYESHECDSRELLCMVVGLNEKEFPWRHDKAPFKDYRHHSKEIKPQNKHLKAEIARRQDSYGLDPSARPGSWTSKKLTDWLHRNPIPTTKTVDLSYLKEKLLALEETIRNKNENPSHEDLLPAKKRGKWKHSKAKEILRDAIISGAVTSDMDAKDVYNSNAEYQKWEYKNFPTNLNNLRTKIGKLYERVQSDCVAYGHDMELKCTRFRSKQFVPSSCTTLNMVILHCLIHIPKLECAYSVL